LRSRLTENVVFVALLGIAAAVLFSSILLFSRKSDANQPLPTIPASPPGNVIVRENALQGTTGWKIPPGYAASTQIQAYASATSVSPGQKLTFYVSTQVDGTLYSIGFYRLGWYGGWGGRLKLLLANQVGHAQGYYDSHAHRLLNCSSCLTDLKVGLIEANWQPSYTLAVPSDWVTGVYLAKFADANGLQTYVPFDVLGNDHSTYFIVTSDTTFEAYNTWGGLSLYEADSNIFAENNNLPRGVKVSFDRPYTEEFGSGHILVFEADAIRWMEQQGYDVSYMSSVDLHEHPRQLLQHLAYLSIGHDEYWTKEMRDGVEYARDHGVSLGFFGANIAYWQMRFEPDSKGIPDRTIVCYKVQTDHNDLALDPLYGKDDARVTSQWRYPIINRPENALLGVMYSELNDQSSFPWQVSPQANSPLLNGTGLQPGSSYGCGLVGYEWDRVFANGATPAGLHIIGASTAKNNKGQPDVSNTTYYIATSGALVFAAGSIYWTTSLDSYRLNQANACSNQNPVVPGIQKLMANVMVTLVTHHLSS